LGESADLAWEANERFLRDQLESGVSRIDFVRETVEDARRAFGSARLKEVTFLDDFAADYGYELVGNSWILKAP
jgi:hypothetical protein